MPLWLEGLLLYESFTLTTDTQQFNLASEQENTNYNAKHLVLSMLTLTLKREHLHSDNATIKWLNNSIEHIFVFFFSFFFGLSLGLCKVCDKQNYKSNQVGLTTALPDLVLTAGVDGGSGTFCCDGAAAGRSGTPTRFCSAAPLLLWSGEGCMAMR